MATDDTLTRTLLIVVGVVLLLPFLLMVLMVPMVGMWGGGHMWDSGMWNGGGAWPWLLSWGVVLLIVLGGGYLLYGAVSRAGSRESDAALEELRIAYARGELSDEEYENRRQRLEHES